MATYTVAHAAEHFEDLVAEAENGDEVVLTRDDRPVLRLLAIGAKPRRVPGVLKGLISVPDDFFDPLTEEELEEWLRPN